MLNTLTLHHFGIIEHLVITFDSGMTVLTGESGAGKSIMVDAMALLSGRPARDVMIYPGQSTAWVEAVFKLPSSLKNEALSEFSDEDHVLIVRRSFGMQSCIVVNDRTITLRKLKEIMSTLVMILGQHDQLQLFDKDYQLALVDEWLDASGLKLKAQYDGAFQTWAAAQSALTAAKQDQTDQDVKRAMLDFQIQDVAQHSFQPEEEDRLNAIRATVRKRAQLQTMFAESDHHVDALLEHAGSLSKLLHRVSDMPRMAGVGKTVDEMVMQIADIQNELDQTKQQLEAADTLDPDALESRLDIMFKLKQKYKVASIPLLLDHVARWQQQLDRLTHADVYLSTLQSQVQQAQAQRDAYGLDLHHKRQAIARRLGSRIAEELRALGFTHVEFEVRISPAAPSPAGCSSADFLICPNPGMGLQPLRSIASGGELSRIFLAIQTILGEKRSVPVIVFDEVDAGVGGLLATQIGKRLQAISRYAQVFCVTHLAQIARFADVHLAVRKSQNKTRTQVTLSRLSDTQMRDELHRMVGGEEVMDFIKG